jgi:hypothetical protein
MDSAWSMTVQAAGPGLDEGPLEFGEESHFAATIPLEPQGKGHRWLWFMKPIRMDVLRPGAVCFEGSRWNMPLQRPFFSPWSQAASPRSS